MLITELYASFDGTFDQAVATQERDLGAVMVKRSANCGVAARNANSLSSLVLATK